LGVGTWMGVAVGMSKGMSLGMGAGMGIGWGIALANFGRLDAKISPEMAEHEKKARCMMAIGSMALFLKYITVQKRNALPNAEADSS